MPYAVELSARRGVGGCVGINTPSQCGILNYFPIYRSFVGMNVYVAYSFVMRRRMVFCEIVRQILKTWSPVNFKLALFHPIFDPIKAHIHGLCFCLIVPLMYPVGVILSVSSGVGCCVFPNSSNVVLMTSPSFALMNTARISASAADDITCFRTLLTIKMALFVSFLSLWVVFFPCKRIPLSCF
jgi:hypothetical protein